MDSGIEGQIQSILPRTDDEVPELPPQVSPPSLPQVYSQSILPATVGQVPESPFEVTSTSLPSMELSSLNMASTTEGQTHAILPTTSGESVPLQVPSTSLQSMEASSDAKTETKPISTPVPSIRKQVPSLIIPLRQPGMTNGPLSIISGAKREPIYLKWKQVYPDARKGSVVPPARHGHRAIPIDDRFVVMLGGGNEGLFSDLNVFDIKSMEWFQPQTTGDIPPNVAAFGAVHDKSKKRILMFGGMTEYGYYSDKLFELKIRNWEWRQLHPLSAGDGVSHSPCPRFGHSFTIVDQKVFLFGGLVNAAYDPETQNIPQYMNDVYILDISERNPDGVWTSPLTYGLKPLPRESHSAVSYKARNGRYNKIIIYGGMCGRRLSDTHVLDFDTKVWSRIANNMPFSPVGRSLHSATLIGAKMFVFGGWAETSKYNQTADPDSTLGSEEKFKCVNSIGCLNVETMMWERVKAIDLDGNKAIMPHGRSGHCAFNIGNRIYIWSGRDGYSREGGRQVCLDDMWQLDVQTPPTVGKIRLMKSKNKSLALSWNPVPGADSYLLQCKVCKRQPTSGAIKPVVNPTTTQNRTMVGHPNTNTNTQQNPATPTGAFIVYKVMPVLPGLVFRYNV